MSAAYNASRLNLQMFFVKGLVMVIGERPVILSEVNKIGQRWLGLGRATLNKAVVALALGLLSNAAFAGSICDYYQKHSPDLFKSICGKGSSSSRPSGAQSSVSDSLNLNAASLPTGPTSVGLESLYSFIKADPTTSSTNFGLIKGFKRHGAGVSTGSGNSFYNNDLLRRQYSTPELKSFKSYENAKGKYINVNFGLATSIVQLSPGVNIKLGASLRYVKATDRWGGGPSLLFETPWFSAGSGVTRVKIASDLPTVTFVSSLATLRLFFLELEYNRLDSSTFHLGPVHIFTASLRIRKLILTAAQRRLDFRDKQNVVQYHYAAQYLLFRSMSIAYMNNYIPGCHTFGLQLYL